MPRFDYRHAERAQSLPIGPQSKPNWAQNRPEIAYILPFFAFLVLMLPLNLGHFAGVDWQALLPVLYPLRTLAAAVLLWLFWPYYTRIRWTKLGLGALVGVIGTVLWVGTEIACRQVGLAGMPSNADIYDPDKMLGGMWGGWAEVLYLCLRVAGPTLVVPVMEELVFRDFGMRLLVKPGRFEEVPVGTFTWLSFLGVAAMFGLNHGRMFMAGIVYGLLMGVLLIRTKSLGACIVAHGVTNFTLYLWVIYTGHWDFM
jgi:CAAX prenyl protease-like protein